MLFKNRQAAGRQLARELVAFGNRDDVVVLAIPRGGVPVAFEVAKALHAPLDIFLSRKLGVPGNEELAFGALAVGDGRFIDEGIVETKGITHEQIARIVKATEETLERRALLYRGGLSPHNIRGKIVILVDDGIATGASIFAAIHALRQMNLKKLVVAAPVAPASTFTWLRSATDELVILHTPQDFHAVGQFYESFSQLSDQEVIELLRRADRLYLHGLAEPTAQHLHREDVYIPAGSVVLEGVLTVPNRERALVIFAHGSGSSRYSPRNLRVAEVLQSYGLATLLFDLLTREEGHSDRLTSKLSFDIRLLAKRLVDVTQWLGKQRSVKDLPMGYFGASTGAAAALVAASRLPGLVSAVVSRGGRPDLAGVALASVRVPTLLIVGDLDQAALTLNEQALTELQCTKQLALVNGATHLFEEWGTLEKAAELAAEWFVRYLVKPAPQEDKEMTVESPR